MWCLFHLPGIVCEGAGKLCRVLYVWEGTEGETTSEIPVVLTLTGAMPCHDAGGVDIGSNDDDPGTFWRPSL